MVKLTQGNIANSHLYLADIIDIFPSISIGGPSATEAAAQLLEIHYGGESPAHTDIAGDKKIFRKRGWIREFFAIYRLCAGASVVIEEVGPFQYRIRPQSATGIATQRDRVWNQSTPDLASRPLLPATISRAELPFPTGAALVHGHPERPETNEVWLMGQLLDRVKRDINEDTFYAQNFSNDGQRFLAWYLRNIYLRTPSQAKDDITDGADDKEIDAVIVDDESRQVIFLQGKFYSTTTVDHEPIHEVLAAWLQIRDLQALQENANNRLKLKIEAVADALQNDYEVVFELVTTGRLTESASRDFSVFQDRIGEFEHPDASIRLVDESVILARWTDAMARELPRLEHTFQLEGGKFLTLDVAHFKTVLAAIKLADCVQLPGIRDGTLFRKNVRQSLGLTNKVNKGIKQTINSQTPQNFFLFHNGITAICDRLEVDQVTNKLHVQGLSVVNGCQSLSTILACGEKAKTARDSYVLFRFYEIPQRELADMISVNTNSQSAVKPRDLRSNDKKVIAIKRAYESTFRDGYLITKRGDERPADRDVDKTMDIVLLARCLMTWHCQRPNIAHNENKLFDEHFGKLFRADYPPADILALNRWYAHIERCWEGNKLTLNEAFLPHAKLVKCHLLFGIQACFCIASNQTDKVPAPSATNAVLQDPEPIITVAGNCYNQALEQALSESQERGRLLNPQVWLKGKDSLLKVQAAIRMYLSMLGSIPGGPELRKSLALPSDKFSARWVAD